MTDLAIKIVHGGQTGVDRGGHEGATANGWGVMGYMPRDERDERGRIPEDVRRFLLRHASTSYAARTEANVDAANAALIVVPDRHDPRTTPGTTKTIDLVDACAMRCLIVDPVTDPAQVARWIKAVMVVEICAVAGSTLMLPLLGDAPDPTDPISLRLLVAGPRESKWPGGRLATAGLLRRVGLALDQILPKACGACGRCDRCRAEGPDCEAYQDFPDEPLPREPSP